jgi:predicted nucleic-acid-binding protein
MKTAERRFGIDANVIIRALVQDHEAHSPAACAVMEAIEDGTLAVECDPVTLGEVVWVLESYYGRSRPDIAAALHPVLNAQQFHITDKERYIRALDLYAISVPHFGDACACAAALDQCEGKLLSFDRKLSRVSGIHRAESAGGERSDK